MPLPDSYELDDAPGFERFFFVTLDVAEPRTAVMKAKLAELGVTRALVLVDEVTTLCGPGELIDVIVTERGIAVNPQREDLLAKLRGSSLPIRRSGRVANLIRDSSPNVS